MRIWSRAMALPLMAAAATAKNAALVRNLAVTEKSPCLL